MNINDECVKSVKTVCEMETQRKETFINSLSKE